jgi:hypothetical protein
VPVRSAERAGKGGTATRAVRSDPGGPSFVVQPLGYDLRALVAHGADVFEQVALGAA